MLPTAVIADRIVLDWRCHQRGVCCHGWAVPVTPREQRRIHDALPAGDGLRGRFQQPPQEDGMVEMPMTDSGHCVFLDGADCGLRRDISPRALPGSCRRFPLKAMLTPRRILVEMSYVCVTSLALLGAQERAGLETVDTCPIDYVLQVCEPGYAYHAAGGAASTAEAFWDTHWEWLQTFAALGGAPTERVSALARLVLGDPPAPLGVDWAALAAAGRQASAHGRFMMAGGRLEVLADVEWAPYTPIWDLGGAPIPTDEPRLVNRYLEHCLLAPEWLGRDFSPEGLVYGLYAIVLMYRTARDWGANPLEAVWLTDRRLRHQGGFKRGGRPPHWQSMAMLALSSPVG